MAKLAEAINLYNPAAQWVINGDDYSTLDWHSTDIPKPTLAQLEELLPELEKVYAEREAAIANAKAQAEAKLEALGLSLDDFRALGL